MKRGNPVDQAAGRKTLSQSVENPVAKATNTDAGNPAKLRVPDRTKETVKPMNRKGK